MKLLYAPWRSKYFKNGSTQRKSDECPFCTKLHDNYSKDRENLLLKRTCSAMVMLNLHPYNAGHLLILPHKHTGELKELTPQERVELMELTNECVTILEKQFDCAGINIGINKGKASGGSVAEHLHIHVLPRFIGDTNFLATLANTKPISFDIYGVYDQLAPLFKNNE